MNNCFVETCTEVETQNGNGLCPVCRGLATTSSAVCTCRGPEQQERFCANCKRQFRSDGSGSVCPICLLEKFCSSCKRYMPAVDFDSTDVKGRCCACIRKAGQHKVRATREDILTEVEIATDHDNDTSFENLFHRVTDEINDIVEHFKLKDR
jgi:hypothetical protein